MNKPPLVSICCITYNHEAYIAQSIQSFLTQITNFEFEIIISDDCSTDKTSDICQIFSQKHKNINYCRNSVNHGMINNWTETLQMGRGKYIAICEGDDYWTDPYKLQKQVDFLEANPEYGMVASDINLIDENGNPLPDNNMTLLQRKNNKRSIDFFDLLESNLVNTLTVCVRSELMKELANKVKKENLWYVYDYWFWLHISLKSKIRIFDEKMANYRVHSNGISQSNFLRSRAPLVFRDVYFTFLEQNKEKQLTKYEIQILGRKFFKLSKNKLASPKTRLWGILKFVGTKFLLLKVKLPQI